MAAPAEQLQSVTVFQRVARSCFMKTPVCILTSSDLQTLTQLLTLGCASVSGSLVWCRETSTFLPPAWVTWPVCHGVLPSPALLTCEDATERTQDDAASGSERGAGGVRPPPACLPSVCVNTPHVIWVSSAWSSPNGLDHLHSVLNLLGVTASSSYLFRK